MDGGFFCWLGRERVVMWGWCWFVLVGVGLCWLVLVGVGCSWSMRGAKGTVRWTSYQRSQRHS
jgi:hypothetical protein